MTERKTKTGALSIFRKIDAGNVPAPWVPPELPASTTALPGRAVAKRDHTSLPAPWVPAELPTATAALPTKIDDRKVAKLKPWVPPAEAPRKLPAVLSDDEGEVEILRPKKRKKRKQRPRELVPQNTGAAAQPIIIHNNIINQSAPAPVVYGPWWGPGWWWRWWWW